MTRTMNVRLKFLCDFQELDADTKSDLGPIYNYTFSAVTHGSPENELYFKFTPAGYLRLSAVRSDLFKVGKEYYLDFVPAN